MRPSRSRLVAKAIRGRTAPAPIVYRAGIGTAEIRRGEGAVFNSAVYVIARVRFPSKTITTRCYSDYGPGWSPDHRRIAFVRHDSKIVGSPVQIWAVNANEAVRGS